MNKIYKCKDCNINLIKDKSIGVIGYGIQGRAQALNLRDSGCSVIIGNNEDEYGEEIEELYELMPGRCIQDPVSSITVFLTA